MSRPLKLRKSLTVDYKEYNTNGTIGTIVGYRKGLNNWLRQFITVVDLHKKEFKTEESLLGIFKWGEFKSLPKINYVLIFRASFVKCESCSIEEYKNNPYSYFQVSLVHNNHHRIIVHETKEKDNAFQLAKKLASGLNTRLKDSATEPGKSAWLI